MKSPEADQLIKEIAEIISHHVEKQPPVKMVRVNAWIENNGGENLCDECGAPVEDRGWSRATDMEMPADHAYCDGCGDPLEEFENPLMKAQYYVNIDENKRQCLRCPKPPEDWRLVEHAIISRNIAKCWKCGEQFEEAA